MSLNLPNKFELSFKLKSNCAGLRFGIVPVQNKSVGNPTYSVMVQQFKTEVTGLYRDNSTHGILTNNIQTDGTVYHEWKIISNGNIFQWYFDGNQVNSDVTLAWFDNYAPHLLSWIYWDTGSSAVKDIVIKAL